ncbi:MAG: hypothetical protein M9924_12990 [Rhizobiaceae bacterium]|nr:hypothetical protein [Rhizobiaceae bacterium]
MNSQVQSVFPNADDAPKSSDARAEAYTVVGDAGSLRIVRPDGSAMPGLFTAPAKEASLRQMMSGSVREWTVLLDQLCEHLPARPHLMFDFYDPMRELFLLGARQQRFTYSLMVSEVRSRIAILDYAIISAARDIAFRGKEAKEAFRKAYVGAFNALGEGEGAAARDAGGKGKAPLANGKAGARVLIVAYFAGQCPTVGAKRINYWFEEMHRRSHGMLDVELASAMPYVDAPFPHHHVPNYDLAEILHAGAPEEWQSAFARTEIEHRRNFSTLSYYWRLGLERYFDEIDASYDVVLLSGNPFSVFDFANYARRRWRSRIVLDYRDPFANNPRMAYSPEARSFIAYVERGYNCQADLISVVNAECAKLAEAPADKPIAIIPNGYDERVLDRLLQTKSKDDRISFAYAGSIYPYGPLAPVVNALDPSRHRLVFVGNDSGLEKSVRNNPAVSVHGPQDYQRAMELIAPCDIGIVFISETGFESTTKIFDYIGLGMDVLICTTGPTKSGQIAKVVENVDNIYWCRNTPEAISEFVAHYSKGKKRADKQRASFSRGASLDDLIDRMTRIL